MNIIKVAALILCCGIVSVEAMVKIMSFKQQVDRSFGWPRQMFAMTLSDGSQRFIVHPVYLGTAQNLSLELPITYRPGVTDVVNLQDLEALLNGGTKTTIAGGKVILQCNEHNVCYLVDMEIEREHEARAQQRRQGRP